jgi:hypothetical protein
MSHWQRIIRTPRTHCTVHMRSYTVMSTVSFDRVVAKFRDQPSLLSTALGRGRPHDPGLPDWCVRGMKCN